MLPHEITGLFPKIRWHLDCNISLQGDTKMKTKILMSMALVTTVLGSVGATPAKALDGYPMHIGNRTGYGMWVTVYNTIGRQVTYGCVEAYSSKLFDGFWPYVVYEVRMEFTRDGRCQQSVMREFWLTTMAPLVGHMESNWQWKGGLIPPIPTRSTLDIEAKLSGLSEDAQKVGRKLLELSTLGQSATPDTLLIVLKSLHEANVFLGVEKSDSEPTLRSEATKALEYLLQFPDDHDAVQRLGHALQQN
jgi:hypothetical protein